MTRSTKPSAVLTAAVLLIASQSAFAAGYITTPTATVFPDGSSTVLSMPAGTSFYDPTLGYADTFFIKDFARESYVAVNGGVDGLFSATAHFFIAFEDAGGIANGVTVDLIGDFDMLIFGRPDEFALGTFSGETQVASFGFPAGGPILFNGAPTGNTMRVQLKPGPLPTGTIQVLDDPFSSGYLFGLSGFSVCGQYSVNNGPFADVPSGCDLTIDGDGNVLAHYSAPVPSTFVLFGSLLAGLAGVQFRRKRT